MSQYIYPILGAAGVIGASHYMNTENKHTATDYISSRVSSGETGYTDIGGYTGLVEHVTQCLPSSCPTSSLSCSHENKHQDTGLQCIRVDYTACTYSTGDGYPQANEDGARCFCLDTCTLNEWCDAKQEWMPCVPEPEYPFTVVDPDTCHVYKVVEHGSHAVKIQIRPGCILFDPCNNCIYLWNDKKWKWMCCVCGTRGPPGHCGPCGPTGDHGDHGNHGETGEPGPCGPTGAHGHHGRDGSDIICVDLRIRGCTVETASDLLQFEGTVDGEMCLALNTSDVHVWSSQQQGWVLGQQPDAQNSDNTFYFLSTTDDYIYLGMSGSSDDPATIFKPKNGTLLIDVSTCDLYKFVDCYLVLKCNLKGDPGICGPTGPCGNPGPCGQTGEPGQCGLTGGPGPRGQCGEPWLKLKEETHVML